MTLPAPVVILLDVDKHPTGQRPDHCRPEAASHSSVELGKVLAPVIIPEVERTTETQLGHDTSTNMLIRRYRKLTATSS